MSRQPETVAVPSAIAALRDRVEPAVRPIRRVYHVGTLDPTQKRSDSYEGWCLSISRHPTVWKAIAQLGGLPTHELVRPGARFLDVHRLARDPAAVSGILDWAVAAGYVAPAPLYRVTTADSDWGGAVTLLFAERAAAEAECAEGAGTLAVESGFVATAALRRRAGAADVPPDLVRDFAIACFVEDHCPTVDGLWWPERLDPEQLSAPRGGIFPSRLAGWRIRQIRDGSEDLRP